MPRTFRHCFRTSRAYNSFASSSRFLPFSAVTRYFIAPFFIRNTAQTSSSYAARTIVFVPNQASATR